MNTERAQELRTRLQAQWDGVISTLSEKIALQAVSAHGIAADHMKASAQYVAQMMQEQGIDAKVVQSTNPDGTPGAWEVIGSKIVDPEAPTVLLYAHHDVQPVPDASEWDTEPFTATIRNGRLYGRGSADDGGGIAIHRGALAILGEELGVNIRIFFEGEEEMGSPSFIPFIEEHAAEFASDVIIVADSGNWSTTIPSLTTSLRGNTSLEVTVKALEHPVHSGQFGGPILDANTLAAMLISSLYNADGELQVPGIAATEPIGGLARDLDEAQVRADAATVEGLQLAGTGSLASRLWTKPSLTVTGFDAHPVEGAFNVIAPSARFALSLRTAPNQRPEEAQKALADYLIEHAPFGAQVSIKPLDNGMGWAMDAQSDVVQIAEEALQTAFGQAPANKGEGGSIPFIPELQRIFPQAKVLVTGPEDPKSNAHSPNESIDLQSLEHNIIAEALFLDELAKSK